ncbi:MAG TPA: hypothetical protein VHV29_18255 [Terriglobales bacterium]|jgi:hypothetical protein|nr:hypothetical protein [Terriglobales bacterium]
MKLLCIVCVVCSSLWAGALDREAFTFTKYDLKVRVEPEQQRLGVRGKISLRNDSSSPQRSLSLQISSTLNWSSIQFEGKPVEFVSQIYTSDIDHTGALSEAIVVLPRAAAPKQTIDLEIGYEGVIPQDVTRLTRIGVAADAAKHSDWDEISRSFTAVRGVGHVEWYPVAMDAVSLSDGDAVPEAAARWKQREAAADFKVALSYSQIVSEPQSDLLCSGAEGLKMPEAMGASQNLELECSFTPLRSAVPSFVAAPYSQVNGKDVVVHYLPDHKAGAGDYSSAVEEVSPLVSKWFGDHRESPKAEVMDLPDATDASFESGEMLLMPLGGSDTKLLLAAAQQLTHLFFPSPQAWIRDGLASFSQVRLIEAKQGRPAAIAYLKAHLSALGELEKVSGGRENQSDSLINSLDDFRVQTKSMYVWWMLRDIIRETALDTALHNYKAADDNGPTYMQKLIERESHRDLQWFFEDWVYHDRGLPEFRVASVYPSQLSTGGYMITVTVENLGAAGAEIPVTLHMQGSEASDRLIVPGKSKASVRIQTPSLPLDVTLNDGSVPESDTSNDVYKIESNH